MPLNSRSAPLADAVPVVPSDTALLNPLPQEIYVGVGGDVTLVGSGPFGKPVTFKNVPNGATLKAAALQIRATGTTATNILAMYSGIADRPTAAPPEQPRVDNSIVSPVTGHLLLSPIDGQPINGTN